MTISPALATVIWGSEVLTWQLQFRVSFQSRERWRLSRSGGPCTCLALLLLSRACWSPQHSKFLSPYSTESRKFVMVKCQNLWAHIHKIHITFKIEVNKLIGIRWAGDAASAKDRAACRARCDGSTAPAERVPVPSRWRFFSIRNAGTVTGRVDALTAVRERLWRPSNSPIVSTLKITAGANIFRKMSCVFQQYSPYHFFRY
jgi:hypothetical protein